MKYLFVDIMNMIDLNLKGRKPLKISSIYQLKINVLLRAGRVCVEAGVSPPTAGAGTGAQSPSPHSADTGLVAIHDAWSGDHVN